MPARSLSRTLGGFLDVYAVFTTSLHCSSTAISPLLASFTRAQALRAESGH